MLTRLSENAYQHLSVYHAVDSLVTVVYRFVEAMIRRLRVLLFVLVYLCSGTAGCDSVHKKQNLTIQNQIIMIMAPQVDYVVKPQVQQLHHNNMSSSSSEQQQEINMKAPFQQMTTTGFASASSTSAFSPPAPKRFLAGATNVGPAVKKQKRYGMSAKVMPQGKGWWRFGDIQQGMVRELIEKDIIRKDASPCLLENQTRTTMPLVATATATIPTPLTATIPTAFKKPLVVNHLLSHTSALPRNPIRQVEDTSYYPEGDEASSSGSAGTEDMDEQTALRFRAYQAENWTEKYEELIEFRNRLGHCLVPNHFEENPTLAQWVKRQRYQYKQKLEGKRSTMSEERIQALEDVGFVWDSHSAAWDERLDELISYKGTNGHCNVPSRYAENRQLAIWVKRQRRQYKFYLEGKASSMTSERIIALDALGFQWDMRTNAP